MGDSAVALVYPAVSAGLVLGGFAWWLRGKANQNPDQRQGPLPWWAWVLAGGVLFFLFRGLYVWILNLEPLVGS